jgi:hypothetical protein
MSFRTGTTNDTNRDIAAAISKPLASPSGPEMRSRCQGWEAPVNFVARHADESRSGHSFPTGCEHHHRRRPWHKFRFATGVLTPLSKRIRVLAIVAGGLAATATAYDPASVLPGAAAAQTASPVEPRRFRRLELDDLRYAGAFRVPATESAGSYFSYGGQHLAVNPERKSMFVSNGAGKVAELTVPELVKGAQISDLHVGEYLQPFSDPAEGRLAEVADEGVVLAGLLVHERRLFGSALIYYDARNTQTVSHFARSLSLLDRSATPMERVGEPQKTGYVAGYMAPVPLEWRALLGGPALTGQCCVPIASRTSLGPSAWVWNPLDLLKGGPVRAASLVHYEGRRATLGPWEGSNPVYGGTTMIGGLAVITGTRTALFIGSTGIGPFCYGDATEDKAKAEADGSCYDPVRPDKGQHAYPYRYQLWAYDLNDWADVRAGKRDPWEVVPYAVWPFELPYHSPPTRIGGLSFDPARRLLYFAQLEVDHAGGRAALPIIHAYFIP